MLALGCSNPRHHDVQSNEYLTKREAAALVIEERKLSKKTLHACNYDPVVKELLNLEEKMEDGVLKFVQKAQAKHKRVAKSALSEMDVNAKIEVDRRSNTTKLKKEADDSDVSVSFDPDVNTGSESRTTSVSTSILDLQSEVCIPEDTKSAGGWPMSA